MRNLVTEELFLNAISSCNGMAEVLRKLNLGENGANRDFIRKLCKKYNVDVPKFVPKRKYEVIEKICPVCGKKFETLKNNKREKVVCSHSCSNTYFRSGQNNPNYKGVLKDNPYREICFMHHPKKCCICGFDYIVEVHHVDCDKDNNDPKNLVPLCSNHHRMYHSKYRQLVSPLIEDYIKSTGM